MNLDVAGDNDDTPYKAVALQQWSMDELISLKVKLKDYPTCGPRHYCKIGKDKKDKHLMHHQLQGWALALVHFNSCSLIVC
jgi:hypothetical protein